MYFLLVVVLVIGLLAYFFSSPINEQIVQNVPVTESPVSPRENTMVEYNRIIEKFNGQDVTRVLTDKKLITLTFDGGGNAKGVKQIVDTLSQYGTAATFFLSGDFIEKFPEHVEAIKESRGEIANHTVSHKNFTTLTNEEMRYEITHMKEIAAAHGITVAPFFRFPYGAYKKGDIELVNELGYIAVRWTVDSLGWQGKIDGRDPPSPGASEGRSAQFVADRVVQNVVPGAIVLMHLGSARDGSTLDADVLPAIITALKAQGYQFVTLSSLFSSALLPN